MALKIEDYALISDRRTGALVGRDGSMDWLCLPRYDSDSVFGALLGSEEHGRWLLAPRDANASCVRSYVEDTFILRTVWTTDAGQVEVTEFMPSRDHIADVVRSVRGISGRVEMHQDLRIRFAYGATVPWVRRLDEETAGGLVAVAGPDALAYRGPAMRSSGRRHVSEFTVEEGQTVDVQMQWFPSHLPTPAPVDVASASERTVAAWTRWASQREYEGPYADAVARSMLVLRALSNEETGGIVAAPTTSLPESFGGSRNWDYRYVWLRDAALTLEVLLSHGYAQGAERWRSWLLRAVAGDPEDVQIMYGISGERDLTEKVIESLPGYEGASPVRRGNGAYNQFQSDVIGEVMVALHAARKAGVAEDEDSWALQRALMGFLEENWERPDQGVWEMRGPAHMFTHSRVMVWAAFDRAVRAITEFGLDGPLERWEQLRDDVRRDVETNGFNAERNTYTQYFGGDQVDASLLVLPQVGFCAPTDPRMLGTVAAIETDLMHEGVLLRYLTHESSDGLTPGENPFLACSFWLAEQYATSGRLDEAKAFMDRLLAFSNDVGLLSEEYDVLSGRQAGNTPQAFSHLTLVRAADAIMAGDASPVQQVAK